MYSEHSQTRARFGKRRRDAIISPPASTTDAEVIPLRPVRDEQFFQTMYETFSKDVQPVIDILVEYGYESEVEAIQDNAAESLMLGISAEQVVKQLERSVSAIDPTLWGLILHTPDA
jgi:hypothetical protein